MIRQLREFTATSMALGATAGGRWRLFWHFTKNLRVRVGLARHHPDRVYTLETRHGPVALRDNFGDVTNLPDLFHHVVYRVREVPGDGVILDVGANIGLFAAWAARHNPGKAIHCFEPLSSNVRVIPYNCPRAVVHHVGVGRERGAVTLAVDAHGAMGSTLARGVPTREERFEVRPLDELTREHGIGAVAFLKIDTEGMELEVLDGGRETLGRTARVAMETHGPALHRGAVERLEAAGFAVEDAPLKGETRLLFGTRR